MRSRTNAFRAALLTAALGMAATAAGQSLPRLPPDIVLPQSGDSPGKVTFSHVNHVGFQAKPDCTACHPKLASILKRPTGARQAPITHEAMLQGRACGACHGKTAHGFDDCATCHR